MGAGRGLWPAADQAPVAEAARRYSIGAKISVRQVAGLGSASGSLQ